MLCRVLASAHRNPLLFKVGQIKGPSFAEGSSGLEEGIELPGERNTVSPLSWNNKIGFGQAARPDILRVVAG